MLLYYKVTYVNDLMFCTVYKLYVICILYVILVVVSLHHYSMYGYYYNS